MVKNMWEMFEPLHEDPNEIFIALRFICGGVTTGSERTAVLGSHAEYEIGGKEALAALEVGYTNKKKPLIRAAPSASPDWEDLLEQTRRALSSEVRWATTPLSGTFRTIGALSTPTLQVRPVDDLHVTQAWHASTPPLNALLVDVAYEHPASPALQATRRITQLREAANLLAVAMWPPVWQPRGRTDWTTLWPPTVERLQNARTPPGFWAENVECEALAPPTTTGYDKLALIPHEEFVQGPFSRLSSGTQHAVETLAELHQKLVRLPRERRKKANRALAWMADAAFADTPSLKIACAVAGIEALLPASPSERCAACGQQSHRLTKRVEIFLDEFAGSALRKSFRDEVYATRSAQVHGLKHYAVDEPIFTVPGTGDLDVLKARGIAHAAVLNWILKQ